MGSRAVPPSGPVAAADDRAVRLAVYRHFAATGHAPAREALAPSVGLTVPDLVRAYRRLADARELVLDPQGGDVLMAHPFSAVPTSYAVRTRDGLSYFANCAWDALSISPVVRQDSIVEAGCAYTGEPLRFEIRAGRLSGPSAVVHFLVPPREFWRDIYYT